MHFRRWPLAGVLMGDIWMRAESGWTPLRSRHPLLAVANSQLCSKQTPLKNSRSCDSGCFRTRARVHSGTEGTAFNRDRDTRDVLTNLATRHAHVASGGGAQESRRTLRQPRQGRKEFGSRHVMSSRNLTVWNRCGLRCGFTHRITLSPSRTGTNAHGVIDTVLQEWRLHNRRPEATRDESRRAER